MFQNSAVTELKNQYEAGKRDFQKIQLRRADLRGINLSHADLSGADLSYAILRDVILMGANLSEAYLNEADLTGANLQECNLKGAYLIKAYLIKTNLQSANLSGAYLTGAYLTRGNLINADLTGAYLNGSKLTSAELTGAYYDRMTHFDTNFAPQKLGMKEQLFQDEEILEISLEELLNTFNYLSQISSHYLGCTMTVKFWQTTKPKLEWLNYFEVERSAHIKFVGERQELLNNEQLQAAKEWINCFLKACCQIIQDFSEMLDPQQIVFPIGNLDTRKKNNGTFISLLMNEEALAKHF